MENVIHTVIDRGPI